MRDGFGSRQTRRNKYVANNLAGAQVFIINGGKKEKCNKIKSGGGYGAAYAYCGKKFDDGKGGKRYPKGSEMVVEWPAWRAGKALIICQAVPYIRNQFSYLTDTY